LREDFLLCRTQFLRAKIHTEREVPVTVLVGPERRTLV
jgi:hypothetical protein